MFLNPPQFILVFFIFCCYEQLKITSGLKCFSCFRSCRGHKSCDCTNGECSGQFCYARIVSYEGFHGVHKGCTSDNAGFLVPDNNCLLDRTDHSADCICDSNNFCNTKRLLRNAKKFLNSVKCCYHNIEVTDLATNTQKCGKVCKGTYCYDDRISDEKGCGHGRSELLRLLR